MDIRKPSEKYRKIGEDLIATEPKLRFIKDCEIDIEYLVSVHAKKHKNKIVFAECEKIPDRYRWAIDSEFTITVFEPNVDEFTEEQLRILIHHELLHIDRKGGHLDLKPHDIEEFTEIINRYGLNWQEEKNG